MPDTSKAETDSSQIINFGFSASARAITIRCTLTVHPKTRGDNGKNAPVAGSHVPAVP